MAYKTQPIQLQHIYLDNTNPRHDPIDNEPELIAYLIAHEQVMIYPRPEDFILDMHCSPMR